MSDLEKKQAIIAEYGLEFDEAANLFSEETLTSMGLSLIMGGEHKKYTGSNENCSCNGNDCNCTFKWEGDNCKCGPHGVDNCDCVTSPTSAPQTEVVSPDQPTPSPAQPTKPQPCGI